MDVRELKMVLKNRLGDQTHFIGVYTSDQIPFVKPSRNLVTMIISSLKSTSITDAVGHWVEFHIEFYPQKRIVFFDSYGISPYDYNILGSSKSVSRYQNIPLYD